MEHDLLLIVVSGGQRYAVAQHAVAALRRIEPDESVLPLSALLGKPTQADEPYALSVAVADRAGTASMRIEQADLRGALPRLALPDWLARLAHPAIAGLALDGAELIPLVDLVQLAHHTGHQTL